MNNNNKFYRNPPEDFVPTDGHADWNPDDYGPDVQEFMHDPDFDNADADVAVDNVEHALRELTDEEVVAFTDYVKSAVDLVDKVLAQDPYEDIDRRGLRERSELKSIVEAKESVERKMQGLSEQEQYLIEQRMGLAMSIFGNEGGDFLVPVYVFQAIMYGTDFMKNEASKDTGIHIPIDLPEKVKLQLEKAINKLLSISDATYWKNMAIATRQVGLTPLDGCIFMDVTIGMFGLNKPFVWDFDTDRLPYINELIQQIHNSKQGDKLYNFFTKLITFQYKDKPIPRSVVATLARDAFCLLYKEL